MAVPASDWLRHFLLFFWTKFNETWQEVRSQCPLPSFSGQWVNKNAALADLSRKMAHCTQVQDMWPFGPLVIPPTNKVWGYIGITLSRSGYFTPLLSLPNGVSWPWPKVISPRSRSQCTHTQIPCPDHNSSLPSWIWKIFHTIIVNAQWVCHDLEPRSYLQGQGHIAHIQKICVQGRNSSLPSWILIISHTFIVHDAMVCHDLDPSSYLQCHVTVQTYGKALSEP